jgi:hypothetical protein
MALKPSYGPKRAIKLKRPAGLPHGRWLGDMEPLSAAEKSLVAASARGVVWEPSRWNGKRPEVANAANRVRAEIIRFLLLGGDSSHPVHELGVMVNGAWVDGLLDLGQARCEVRLRLFRCHIEQVPIFVAAFLPELSMRGSKVPGLIADRMEVAGGVNFGDGFTASDEIRLPGASIGGNLDCNGASFRSRNRSSLTADNMKIKGSVSLSRRFRSRGEIRLPGAFVGGNLTFTGARIANKLNRSISADGIVVKGSVFFDGLFISIGEVRLLGGDIGGALHCSGGRFLNKQQRAISADRLVVRGSVYLDNKFLTKGMVYFLGADIGGDFYFNGGLFQNIDGKAISAGGMKVERGLFLRGATVEGIIDLATARAGTLVDEAECSSSRRLILDGFQYERIVGTTDVTKRIAWLRSQRLDHLKAEFKPQPWEHLIKVLREMGHSHEATEVAIAKQEALRAAGKFTNFRRVLHFIYGKLAGYGYRPMRTVGSMAIVWLIASFLYWIGADQYAAIGPANPVITSEKLYPEAGVICGHGNEEGKRRWTECPGVPDEYSTFQPFIYSLDLILPLVDLQQESDWAPIAEGPTGQDLVAGVILRWLMWFEILFGWIASLTLVAVLGRLVEKD